MKTEEREVLTNTQGDVTIIGEVQGDVMQKIVELMSKGPAPVRFSHLARTEKEMKQNFKNLDK
ncbi:hypothetical protein ABER99_20635 [Paenibacillus glucanolyticus]|jgi:hypothetical protein|uniref:Uncharacterized protein n=1 Tax=Paenibacillus glucanolyticus TaxID=59843 RepID=A0A168EWB1_9BACL|nr:hypothetical protein [Paenibacillus glucanolyticus]KZS44889.1 hypothetical protein AWU65_02585 [Paenibacillus glucanolyticus]OMF65563.1 hypothetical protein BK142_30600 [Paenibacillus glucanolyticus]